MASDADWKEAMTPVDRSRSMPNEEHLKNNPCEINPYEILNGPSDGECDDMATQFSYCLTTHQFGLTTGSNSVWCGPTMEYLETHESLFKFNACDYSELEKGNIIIHDRLKYTEISKKDFIPIVKQSIYNWNGQSIKNCRWLNNIKTWVQMLKISQQAISMECKVSTELCDEIEQVQAKTKVCNNVSIRYLCDWSASSFY